MAGNDEPVTSPDQRKPTNRKVAYTVTILGIITMLAYLYGNHEGRVEDLWLWFTAGVLALGLAAVFASYSRIMPRLAKMSRTSRSAASTSGSK